MFKGLSTGIFFHLSVLGCISVLEMARDATILIRLTKEEKAQINKVARAAGGMVSEWIREALLGKARMDCQETPIIAAARCDYCGASDHSRGNCEKLTTVMLKEGAYLMSNDNRMPKTPSQIAVPGASTEEQPMKVNGEPPLDIPEIPLNDPGPYTTDPAYGDSEDPPVESGVWLDGEWVPD